MQGNLFIEWAILEGEFKHLHTANEDLSRRRRAKKTQLRSEGSLSIQDVQGLQAQAEVDGQLKTASRQSQDYKKRVELCARRCRFRGERGHHAYTYENDKNGTSEEDSDWFQSIYFVVVEIIDEKHKTLAKSVTE